MLVPTTAERAAPDAGTLFCCAPADSEAFATEVVEDVEATDEVAATRPTLETKPEPVAPTKVEVVWTSGYSSSASLESASPESPEAVSISVTRIRGQPSTNPRFAGFVNAQESAGVCPRQDAIVLILSWPALMTLGNT